MPDPNIWVPDLIIEVLDPFAEVAKYGVLVKKA
jgi:hypothetical protein